MASNPQLPNHLIRELTNILRDIGSGEAMVLLALSGKEPLSVFEYVVNTHVNLRINDDALTISNNDKIGPLFDFHLAVSTEGARRFFSRYVRILEMVVPVDLHLPIDWDNLKDLSVFYASDSFVADIVNGTISLKSLQKFTFGSIFDQYLKLLSTTSCFSLPEDVIFNVDVKDGDVTDHASFQMFPKVKHFEVCFCYKAEMTVKLLHQFSAIVKCFPSLETAVFDTSAFGQDFCPDDYAEVVSVKEELCKATFSVPVTIRCIKEFMIKVQNSETPEDVFDRLESIGFKRGRLLADYLFDFDTETDNVKLEYWLVITPYTV